MNNNLMHEYEIIIQDLERARRKCGFFQFKRRKGFTDIIKHYQNKMNTLEKQPPT